MPAVKRENGLQKFLARLRGSILKEEDKQVLEVLKLSGPPHGILKESKVFVDRADAEWTAARLKAARPHIRTLAERMYMLAPDRHRFGIYGVRSDPPQEEEEDEEFRRQKTIKFSRFARVSMVDGPDDYDRSYYVVTCAKELWDAAIEVNKYKRTEMSVHPASACNTTTMRAPSIQSVKDVIDKRRSAHLEATLNSPGNAMDKEIFGVEYLVGRALLSFQCRPEFWYPKMEELQLPEIKKSDHCRRNAIVGLDIEHLYN